VSLRTRFIVTVVAIVAVTATLFASLSIVVLDRTLRSNFIDRLHSGAQTIASTVDVHHGRISLDPSDLRTLNSLQADTPFGVYDAGGRQIAGDTPPTAAQSALKQRVTVPVTRDNHTFGTVAVWQSNEWIGDFDRTAAMVSVGIGLFLVVLGAIASLRVARRVLMLERLEAAFSRERRFVADASHELRAPLAVLRAETELALRRERTGNEYRAALASIAREGARLEELVNELLATARAEVDAREQETLDANELLTNLGDRVRATAATRGIEIRVENSGVMLAQANRATLERALLAIAHNAIRYGRDDGTVRMRSLRDDGLVRIEIADDGPGFTSDALAHATERFWRGDTARQRDGTGLGLAIARAFVEANRGTLQIANSTVGGAVVTIELASS
jgi:signal transduction histidine kinase